MINEPTPDPVAAPRRWLVGWALLVLIYGLNLYGSIAAPQPEETVEEPSTIELDQMLKGGFVGEVIESVGADSPAYDQSDERALNSLLNSVSRHLESPKLARYHVAASFELDREPSPQALETLAEDDSETSWAFFKIYSSEGLSEEEARQLAGFEGEEFIFDLATAHALQKAGLEGARDALPLGEIGWMIAGMGMMFGAIALGILLGLGYLVLRLSGKLEPVGFPPNRITAFAADIRAGAFALYLAGFLVIGGVLAFTLGEFFDSMWLNVLMMIATLAGLVVLGRVLGLTGETFRSLVGRTEQPARQLAIGGIGALINLPIVFGLVILVHRVAPGLEFGSHPLTDTAMSEPGAITFVLMFLLAAVFAPVVEEFTFRGLLWPALGRVVGSPVVGALLMSVVFATLHPQGPAAMIMLAAIGCAAAFMAYQTGSLLSAIGLHAVHNGLIVLFSFTL